MVGHRCAQEQPADSRTARSESLPCDLAALTAGMPEQKAYSRFADSATDTAPAAVRLVSSQFKIMEVDNLQEGM